MQYNDIIYFDVNRKGEFYKTCRNCLNRDRNSKHANYEANKERILEKVQNYYREHNEQILEQKKQYKLENKDYLLEKLNCECGGSYVRHGHARHLRTLKHQDYLDKLNNNVSESLD